MLIRSKRKEEKVRYQFYGSVVEESKSKLNYLTNVELALSSAERESIIDYNEKYAKYLNLLTDMSFGAVDTEDNRVIAAYHQKLAPVYSDYIDSDARFKLFISNSTLINSADTLKIQTFQKLQRHPGDCLINLRFNNNAVSIYQENFSQGDPGQRKKLYDERHQILEKFRTAIVADLPKIIGL